MNKLLGALICLTVFFTACLDSDTSPVKSATTSISQCNQLNLAQCQLAETVGGAVCVIESQSSRCVAVGDSLVSTFNPIIRNAVYQQRVDLGADHPPACLNNSSRYFRTNQEVNQFLVDISTRLTQDLVVYRWGKDRESELLRVGKPIPFYPIISEPNLSPIILEIFDIYRPQFGPGSFGPKTLLNPQHALTANFPGTTSWAGPGLYVAFNPLDSMGFGDVCIQLTVKAGNLIVDPSDPLVQSRLDAVELEVLEAAQCNPPIVYVFWNFPETNTLKAQGIREGWLVLKDPTAIKAEEFDGKAFSDAQLKAMLCSPHRQADEYPAKKQYLMNRVQATHPGFACPSV